MESCMGDDCDCDSLLGQVQVWTEEGNPLGEDEDNEERDAVGLGVGKYHE